MTFLTRNLLFSSVFALATVLAEPINLDRGVSTVAHQPLASNIPVIPSPHRSFGSALPAPPQGLANLTDFIYALEQQRAGQNVTLPDLPAGVPSQAEIIADYDSSKPKALAKRGGCDQGKCPDNNAPFDQSTTRVYRPSFYYDIWVGRVNDCGSCIVADMGGAGCWDFNSCGRDQNICVDPDRGRAHRVWKDNGHKTCYYLSSAGYNCNSANVRNWWPYTETACSW